MFWAAFSTLDIRICIRAAVRSSMYVAGEGPSSPVNRCRAWAHYHLNKHSRIWRLLKIFKWCKVMEFYKCGNCWNYVKVTVTDDRHSDHGVILYIYIYTHMCIYIYIHIYTHMRTYIYIYIYICVYIHVLIWMSAAPRARDVADRGQCLPIQRLLLWVCIIIIIHTCLLCVFVLLLANIMRLGPGLR